jgi:hypothetical protein
MKKLIKVKLGDMVPDNARYIKSEYEYQANSTDKVEYVYYETQIEGTENIQSVQFQYKEEYRKAFRDDDSKGCGGAMSGKPSACGCGECG